MSDYTRSDLQRETSRKNGSASKGPISDAGKARSSQNNLQHGMRTSRVILANESQDKYDRLLTRYTAIFNPVGQIEYDVVVRAVDAQWRLRRIKAMEAAIVSAEMFIEMERINAAFDPVTPEHRQAEAIMSLAVSNPTGLEYYERAETRLTRTFDRSVNLLIRLQTIRTGEAPAFNFTPETSEPDTDQSNCEENENFAYVWRFYRDYERRMADRSNPVPSAAQDPPAHPEPIAA